MTLRQIILPGEYLRLHIRERKDKNLINRCFADNGSFVAGFMPDEKGSPGYGCMVKLADIERFYPDGRMDIRVKGIEVVRILKIKKLPFGKFDKVLVSVIEQASDFPRKVELAEQLLHYFERSHIYYEDVSQVYDWQIYDFARHLKLSDTVKARLIENSGKPANQVVLLLNELKMLISILNLSSEQKFKFYMN